MNYDLSKLPANFNWETSLVYALLYEGAVFDPADQRASDVGTWQQRELLPGRFVTDNGDWAGLPALFYSIAPGHQYQLVLGYDDGSHDEYLLAFFDENVGGAPIEVARRGSLFVRPAIEEEGTPPTYGLWLRPEAA